jgi:hypothetical protein
MQPDILELHRQATVVSRRRGYEVRKRSYEALHEAAAKLTAQLPFRWHSVAMDNPTQNHTGTTNGSGHIVLDEPYRAGRLVRDTGQPLCGAPTANLFGDTNHVTCKRCLELAQRIVRSLT